MNLYDVGDEEDSNFGTSFAVNKTFAAAYETKKRTEELSKLQDKYGADHTLEDEEDSEEDLSDEDSDAELVTPAVDVAILRTLARIRKKDPAVYEEGRQVFDEEEQQVASTSTSTKNAKQPTGKSKPVLLKDYQRSRLLADPTDSLPDSVSPMGFLPTFAQEERALKEEVTRAFHVGDGDDEDDEDEDLLVPREKTKDEREREDEEYDKFLKANVGDRDVEDALEQEEKFLRDYILNRGWIDRSGNKSRIPSYNEITNGHSPPPPDIAPTSGSNSTAAIKEKKVKKVKAVVAEAEGEDGDEVIPDPGQHDSEDEEFEEKAEEFEQKYNFRFEEAAGPTIQTHSRTLASATVRRPTAVVSARARAREAAKEKKDEEKLQRKEEIRRLKALKRKEVEEKLTKLVEVSGNGTNVKGLEDIDLDADWDPEEHDRKMHEIYGGDYQAVDDDPEFKPSWDDDIDISDLPIAGDDDDDDEPRAGRGNDMEEALAEEVKKPKKDKGKRKRDEEGFPTELLEAAKNGGDEARKRLLDQMVEDYYKLDYEDKIAGMPTRFKYAKVAPTSFNLTPAEILLATDTELNSYVSLRKLAPYRQGDDSSKAGKNKKRLKELRDALKNREWGVDLDEDALVRSNPKKWSEENGRKKNGEAEEEPKEGKAAKRIGKKERERRKKAAAEAGEGTAEAEEKA